MRDVTAYDTHLFTEKIRANTAEVEVELSVFEFVDKRCKRKRANFT